MWQWVAEKIERRGRGSGRLEGACTFATATELYSDALVHVLGQVEDILLLGPLALVGGGARSGGGGSSGGAGGAGTTGIAASARASLSRSIGHGASLL